ncbi:hypothetical protein DITRI_Ditri15bG0005900 [Diplodiscus trichospermus]
MHMKFVKRKALSEGDFPGAGRRGSAVTRKNCWPHNNDNTADTLQISYFHAIPESSRQRRACWRVTCNGIWQHYRALSHQRSVHRDGSHLWSSLWRQEIFSPQPNLPQNIMSPTTYFHTDRDPLAKCRARLPTIRPGSGSYKNCQSIHGCLHSGTDSSVSPPSNEDFSEISGHNHPSNHCCHMCSPPAPSDQLHFHKAPLKPWHGVTILSIFQGWRPLLVLALPSLLSVCLEWWWYEIMLFLCGLLTNPKASVAAMGILIQTAGLLYNFPFSISSSISTRVSQALGAGQPSCAHRTAIIGLLMAFAFGLSAFVSTTVLKSWWGTLFTDEPQILELISTVLPILGLCEVGNSPQTAACGVLTGTARPKDGVRINLCSFYLVGLPVAILTTFKLKFGFEGLWFGLLAAQISCVCMMLYTLMRTDWKHQAKRADELTSMAAGGKDDIETSLLITDH